MSTFFIADLHLGHESMAIKRGFESAKAMEEYLIQKWNSVINKRDKVFILGDITMETNKYYQLGRLNGLKHVVLGNHDKHNHVQSLFQYVQQISGMVSYNGYWLTHCPVHPRELSFRVKGNIHGHIHEHTVYGNDDLPDNRYMCVSCEHLDYTPIEFNKLTNKENE